MNRLRVLRQRATRAKICIVKLDDGYVVAHGHGWGNCSKVVSKREAILLASRWALPWKRHKMQVTISTDEGKIVSHSISYVPVNW